MIRNVVLLAGYARRHFLSWTAGWSFALTIYFSRLVTPLVGFALWTRAIPNDPRIAAYYVAMIFCVMATDSPENHTFASDVYEGKFTDILLRPHPAPFSAVGFNIAFKAFNLLGALPVGLAVVLLADVRLEWSRILVALPAVVLGSSIAFCLLFTLAQSSFWTPRVHAVTSLGQSLVFTLGGTAAPIPLLPEQLRGALGVLPFRMINGFPVEVAAGLTTGREIANGYLMQLAWLLMLGSLCRVVWKAGVKRYVAVGA